MAHNGKVVNSTVVGAAGTKVTGSLNDNAQLPMEEKTIYLENVLNDTGSYHGLSRLTKQAIYLIIAVLAVLSQNSNEASPFQTSVVQSFLSFDAANNWEISYMKDVDSVLDGSQYILNYLTSAINKTDGLDLPKDTSMIQIGQFGGAKYMRIHFLPWKCQEKRDVCYKDLQKQGKALEHLEGGMWSAGKSEWYDGAITADILVPPPTTSGQQTVLVEVEQRIEKLKNESVAIMGRYGRKIVLEMYVESRSRGADKPAGIFFMVFKVGNDGRRMAGSTSAMMLKTRYPAEGIILFILFIAAWFLDVLKSIHKYLMSYLQHKKKFEYFKRVWHVLDLLVIVFNLVWICWWFACLALMRKVKPPQNTEELNKMISIAYSLTAWFYWGIMVFLLLGGRLSRYMTVHKGLSVFYVLFRNAMSQLWDFFVYVCYVILVLGSAIFAIIRINGSNDLFVLYRNGLNTMGRVAFGDATYSDYYSTSDDNSSVDFVVQLLFWIAIILLVVFVSNTLLAVFNDAYDDAKHEALTNDQYFVGLCFRRLLFVLVYGKWIRRTPLLLWAMFSHDLDKMTYTINSRKVCPLPGLPDGDVKAPNQEPTVTGGTEGSGCCQALRRWFRTFHIRYRLHLHVESIRIMDKLIEAYCSNKHPHEPLQRAGWARWPYRLMQFIIGPHRLARWRIAALPESAALYAYFHNAATGGLLRTDMMKPGKGTVEWFVGIWALAKPPLPQAPSDDESSGRQPSAADAAPGPSADNGQGKQLSLAYVAPLGEICVDTPRVPRVSTQLTQPPARAPPETSSDGQGARVLIFANSASASTQPTASALPEASSDRQDDTQRSIIEQGLDLLKDNPEVPKLPKACCVEETMLQETLIALLRGVSSSATLFRDHGASKWSLRTLFRGTTIRDWAAHGQKPKDQQDQQGQQKPNDPILEVRVRMYAAAVVAVYQHMDRPQTQAAEDEAKRVRLEKDAEKEMIIDQDKARRSQPFKADNDQQNDLADLRGLLQALNDKLTAIEASRAMSR